MNALSTAILICVEPTRFHDVNVNDLVGAVCGGGRRTEGGLAGRVEWHNFSQCLAETVTAQTSGARCLPARPGPRRSHVRRSAWLNIVTIPPRRSTPGTCRRWACLTTNCGKFIAVRNIRQNVYSVGRCVVLQVRDVRLELFPP